MNVYTKNINNYLLYRLFLNLRIIGPILIPFMLLKGLNYSEIMLLQSIFSISVFLFEIPTGTLADKLSRKVSLFLSGIFFALGLILYIVFKNFFVFAIAEIIFGIGITLSSGADTALLYESLNGLGRKKDFQKIEGISNSYVFISQAFGSILSGFLYKYNPFLPFWISVLNVIIASIIALGFIETDREKSEHKYIIHVFKSFNIVLKKPRILWAIIYSLVMGLLFKTGFWLYQPYFSHVDIDIQYFGIIFFIFNIIAAISSKYLVSLFSEIRPRKILLSLIFLMFLSFILPAIFVSKWAIFFLALQQIVRAMDRPTMNFYINHQVEDKYRATVISMVSLVANLSFALLSPLIGLLLDEKGTITTYLTLSVISIIGFFILFNLRKKQKKLK